MVDQGQAIELRHSLVAAKARSFAPGKNGTQARHDACAFNRLMFWFLKNVLARMLPIK
jgi:hypothetical protein